MFSGKKKVDANHISPSSDSLLTQPTLQLNLVKPSSWWQHKISSSRALSAFHNMRLWFFLEASECLTSFSFAILFCYYFIFILYSANCLHWGGIFQSHRWRTCSL